MPKDELDADDPLELNGAVVPCAEDNDEAMAIAFIEEFLLLNFTADGILDLFLNPAYIGPHRVFRNKGGDYVRDLIAQTLEPWTRPK
ncbi:MAG TPA: hypothetical protein PLU30_05855 [Verrucomicrobiae bacterium]|nr:hypothetical protein [Verrucomicrobiae bacterium]